MDAKMLQNETPSERLQILRHNAEKSEQFTYPKSLDENELNHLKTELAKGSIQLAKHEESRKEFLTELKSKVKPLKVEQGGIINKIRTQVEEVEEEVFLIADQDEGMMGYYNSKGLLIHQRMLQAEEKQFRIVDESNNGAIN